MYRPGTVAENRHPVYVANECVAMLLTHAAARYARFSHYTAKGEHQQVGGCTKGWALTVLPGGRATAQGTRWWGTHFGGNSQRSQSRAPSLAEYRGGVIASSSTMTLTSLPIPARAGPASEAVQRGWIDILRRRKCRPCPLGAFPDAGPSPGCWPVLHCPAAARVDRTGDCAGHAEGEAQQAGHHSSWSPPWPGPVLVQHGLEQDGQLVEVFPEQVRDSLSSGALNLLRSSPEHVRDSFSSGALPGPAPC